MELDLNQLLGLDKFNKDLAKSIDTFGKFNTEFKKLQQEVGNARGFKEFAEAQKKSNEATKEQKKSLTELEKIEKQLVATTEKHKVLLTDQNKELVRSKTSLANRNKELKASLKAERDQEKATKNITKALQAEVKTIRQAQEANKLLRNTIKDVDATTAKGQATITKYNKKIDENTSFMKDNSDGFIQSKINVGNYEESIVSALEKLDVFGVGLGGFAKKMMQYRESTSRAAKNQTALSKAQGVTALTTGSLSKALEVFRLALISTGIGAIIVALGLLMVWLSKVQKGMDFLSDAMAGLGSVINTVIGTIFDANKSFDDLATNIVINFKEAVRLEKAQRNLDRATKALSSTLIGYNAEIERNNKLADDATRSFKERERAAERARKLQGISSQQEAELAQQNFQLATERLALAKREGNVTQELKNATIDARNVMVEASSKALLVELDNEKTRRELVQDRLERDLDILLDDYDNQKTINEKKIENDIYTFEQRQKLLDDTVTAGEESFDRQIETIQKFTDIQINADKLLSESNQQKQIENIRLLGLSEIIEGRLLEIIRDRRTAVNDLADTEQSLNSARSEADAINLENQREAIQEGVDAMFLAEEEKLEFKRIINEIFIDEEADFLDEMDELRQEDVERAKEAEEKKREEILKSLAVTQQSSNLAFDIIKNANNTKLAGIQNELDALNTKAQTEEGLTKLESDRQKKLATDKAKIIRKQAIADKAQALIDIAIHTAVAIMKAAPNIPLQILTGIAGASAAIAVAAQPLPPIPQFYKGTDSAPRGDALVGERGAELVMSRDGGAWLTPDVATLVNLKGGEKIYTAQETASIMKGNQPSVIDNNINVIQHINTVDKDGVKYIIKDNNSKRVRINKYNLAN